MTRNTSLRTSWRAPRVGAWSLSQNGQNGKMDDDDDDDDDDDENG